MTALEADRWKLASPIPSPASMQGQPRIRVEMCPEWPASLLDTQAVLSPLRRKLKAHKAITVAGADVYEDSTALVVEANGL